MWLLKSSPLRIRDLLWAKFWIGTLPLLVLALGIVFVTNVLLQVSSFMMYVSLFSITLLTFALAGLALALGTLFPQFDTENAAQIPTSFGGLVYMMGSIALIGAVVVLEARPVYSYVSARAFGTEASLADLVVGFVLAAALCIATLVGSVTLAVRRLSAVER
jgi:ABC-2 type transport system permease protein